MSAVSLFPAVIAVVLVTAGRVSAQYVYPYGLDPYKPTDAALLRDYGAVLVAQTPLLELHKLDPYVPSQAALRRQMGALPLWGMSYGPFASTPARRSSRSMTSTGSATGVAASAAPASVNGDTRLTPVQPRLDQNPRRDVRAPIPGRLHAAQAAID